MQLVPPPLAQPAVRSHLPIGLLTPAHWLAPPLACRPPPPLTQVRTASCAGTACVNSFGDEQLAVDMLADKLLFEALKYSVSATLYYIDCPSCPAA